MMADVELDLDESDDHDGYDTDVGDEDDEKKHTE